MHLKGIFLINRGIARTGRGKKAPQEPAWEGFGNGSGHADWTYKKAAKPKADRQGLATGYFQALSKAIETLVIKGTRGKANLQQEIELASHLFQS